MAPSPQLSILSKTDLDYLNFGAYPANPYYQSFRHPPERLGQSHYTDLFDITANAPMEARDKFFRTILKAEYHTDGGSNSARSAPIQEGNTRYGADLDGTSSASAIRSPAPRRSTGYFFDTVERKQYTQEFNIISPDTSALPGCWGRSGCGTTTRFRRRSRTS